MQSAADEVDVSHPGDRAPSWSPGPVAQRWIMAGVVAGVIATGFFTGGDLSTDLGRNDDVLAEAREFTLESEGFVAEPYHPTPGSGVTIGYGYDMGSKTSADIRRDLVAVDPAIDSDTILRLGDAAGLTGDAASAFVAQTNGISIDRDQAQDLFDHVYREETATARAFATDPASYAGLGVDYPAADWDSLHPAIVGIVVDLKFRGDYRPWWEAQGPLQDAIVANDPEAVLAELRRIEIFPDDLQALAMFRFQARIDWMERMLA